MKHRHLAVASLIALSAMSPFSAVAGDGPRNVIPVFRVEFEPEDKFRHLIFTDVSASSPGQELLGLTYSCSRSAPDGNGNVKTTVKTRFVFRPAGGGSNIFNPSPVPSVQSLPYPDPSNPANQCGGPNQTDFDEGDFPNTNFQGCALGEGPYMGQSFSLDEDPCEEPLAGGHFGVGVATGVEGAKFVVFSDAVTGTFRNVSTGGNDVDVSSFGIHVYNPAGARLWTKTFSINTGAGRLEPVLSGVGDFLNDDSVDELRVARIADTQTGQAFTYWYYNIATGAQIGSAITVNVAFP